MFTSLRSRLWLSYAFIVFTALCIVMGVLFIYLLRNPFLYRQALGNLNIARMLVTSGDDSNLQTDIFRRMDNVAKKMNIRLLLFSADRELIHDTGAGSERELGFPRTLGLRKFPVIRDDKGIAWLYTTQQLPDQTWLVSATPRPQLSILGFLADEIVPPFMWGGLIALTLSLAVAFVVSRWVADPLQEVVIAAAKMPSDAIQPIETRGPHEVQDLTRAFNEMIARLQAGQKVQRDFIANVSHELKTPLTSIEGFAQALLDGTAETPAARRQAAQIIQDESARMHRMVIDLLELARLDSGIANLHMSLTSVEALLSNVKEKFEPIAQRSGVQLVLQMPDNLPIINADGDRLAQVLTNLVDNALKHTPSGGMVTLRASIVMGELCISVVDTGAGIPLDALPHIFERFYRAESSYKGGESHGLGLAIAREIIQAHGGRITAHSQPGQGATIVVYLPLASSISTIHKKS